MGQFFGRPTEEAVGQMMWSNESIVKLGFECDDAHWRNIIDRSLLRNNDFFRRRQAPPDPEALPTAEERPLGQVRLLQPPDVTPQEVLSKYAVLCEYLDHNLKMPTTSQLQNCAKNSGLQLSYAVAAPMIKELRLWIMSKAVGQEVMIFDIFGTSISGTLRHWCSEHDNWSARTAERATKRPKTRSERRKRVWSRVLRERSAGPLWHLRNFQFIYIYILNDYQSPLGSRRSLGGVHEFAGFRR
ncbi:unnamed protein product [Durusdinium trenchii]|uniref:Uncharacterized protein n=1 Tax=Durusdinium trenchii TaxID=1381693 RepID=A0ABP0R6H2_9DINO